MQDFKNHIIEYETDRIVLKTLETSHVSEAYVHWLNDPEINRYLEIRHGAHTAENVGAFVQKMLDCPDNLQLGMFLKDGGRHIGNIKLGPVNWRYGRADIGLLIGEKDCWGQGYATEAIEGVCEIACASGLRRVSAGAYASNIGSLKAFEKAGFTQEGRLKSHWMLDGEPEDHIAMGKVF